MPGRLTMIGRVLILASGIVSLVIALTFGAVLCEVDPIGLFGHVESEDGQDFLDGHT